MVAQMETLLYARVSTTKQKVEGTSLKTQMAVMRTYAAERGYPVAGEFEDDHTGADEYRPGLNALRDLLKKRWKQGKQTVVIAYALDRLAREQTLQGVICYEIEMQRDGKLELVTEDFDNSPQGKLLRAMYGFLAEMERVKITERTTRGQRERVEQGALRVGGSSLYGYQYADEKKSAYIEDMETAEVVRRIFREVAQGTSLNRLAHLLTEEGVATPSQLHAAANPDTQRHVGAGWRRGMLSRIIKNPTYMGRHAAYRWKVEKTQRYDEFQDRTVPVRSTKLRDATDPRVIEMPHAAPALVDAQVWHTANARLEVNKAFSTRNNRNPEAALLRGFAVCGYCGAPMHVEPGSNKYQTYVYRCSRRKGTDGYAGCEGLAFTVPVEVVDEQVWAEEVAKMENPEAVRRVVESARKGEEESEVVAHKRRLEALLKEALGNLEAYSSTLPHIKNEVSRTALIRNMEDAGAMVEKYEADLLELVDAVEKAEERMAQLDFLEGMAEVFATIHRELTYDQKRLVLMALGVKVKMLRGKTGPHAREVKRYEIEDRLHYVGMADCVSDLSSSYQPEMCSTGTVTRSKRVW